MRRHSPRAFVLVGVVAALAVAAPPAAGAPKVRQLVVQKSGRARQATVTATRTRVKVGNRQCVVPSATALAALLVSDVPRVRLHDYGSCSDRAQDAAGLFVRAIDGDANKGTDGWVYKAGNKLATAGAADPSGPFGNGRLKNNARVTWFYCHLDAAKHTCQQTLRVSAQQRVAGKLAVHVKRYDDRGHGKPAKGATVHAGGATAKTDKDGDAELGVPPGHYVVYAEKPGLIRSFGEEADAT